MRMHRVVAALAVIALTGACKKHDAKNDANEQIAQLSKKLGIPIDTSGTAGGAQSAEGDPCSLLDTSLVTAAIGPLAAPPGRGTDQPQPSAQACPDQAKTHPPMPGSGGRNGRHKS